MKRILCSILLSLLLITNTTLAWQLDFNAEALFKNSNSGDITAAELIDKIDTGMGKGLTSILALIKNLGLVICVCVIAFMGIQFVIASPQKKAELKSGIAPYLVGLLLLIAGVPIAIYIINIFVEVFSNY